jgi:pimeloyl-ACP methyl ester carboxylesterase
MMMITAKRCVALLAVLSVALAVALGVLAVQFTHQPRRFLHGQTDPDLALRGADRIARCGQVRERQNPRALYKLDFESVAFAGPAGTLRGWFVPATSSSSSTSSNRPNTTIVFAPGAGSHIVLEPLRALPTLRRFANVLAFDTASCGASDGDSGVGFGNREWRDVLAAVDFVLARDPSSRIVLAGHSAGAAASIHAASEILADQDNTKLRRVDGLISSSTFASLQNEAVRHIVSGHLRGKLSPRWRALADALVGERLARWLAALVHIVPLSHGEWLREPVDSMRRIVSLATRPLRILIVHGEHDSVVHVDNAALLAAAATSPAAESGATSSIDNGVALRQCIVPRMSHSFIELWSQIESTCIGSELEQFFDAVSQG